MRVAQKIGLSDKERLKLERASKGRSTSQREKERSHIILLAAQGRENKEIAKRHGHNPEAYLTDVLERLPALTNKDDLTVLLRQLAGRHRSSPARRDGLSGLNLRMSSAKYTPVYVTYAAVARTAQCPSVERLR